MLHEVAANQSAGATETSLAMHTTPFARRKAFQNLQKFFRLSHCTTMVRVIM